MVVGLPSNSDILALQNLYFSRKFEGSGRFRNALGGQHLCRIEPNLEPQVISVSDVISNNIFINGNNILLWISGLVCLPS